jgi:hypothetical protein
MRHLFVFVLVLVLLPSAFYATHITGGEITYSYLGNNQYEIVLRVYRDCGPDNTNNTGFDDPANIGIYQNGGLVQSLTVSLFTATVTQLPAGIESTCIDIPDGLCIEECTYTTTTTLASSAAGYDIVYLRCCRSLAIINLNGEQGMTCNAHIPGTNETPGTNSSATFNELPPLLFCANVPFEMDHSATDADGDALTYSLCPLLLGADSFNPQPPPPISYTPGSGLPHTVEPGFCH